jgi:hypothetical protein
LRWEMRRWDFNASYRFLLLLSRLPIDWTERRRGVCFMPPEKKIEGEGEGRVAGFVGERDGGDNQCRRKPKTPLETDRRRLTVSWSAVDRLGQRVSLTRSIQAMADEEEEEEEEEEEAEEEE